MLPALVPATLGSNTQMENARMARMIFILDFFPQWYITGIKTKTVINLQGFPDLVQEKGQEGRHPP